MHEANFTNRIVEAILEAADRIPGARPRKVRVLVGEMLHLAPASVALHYDRLTRGTRLEGVRLELEEKPARIRCRRCGREGGVEDHHFLICARCGSTDADLLSGNEIVVDSIEVEESIRP
ncbi:MAG: hydrogenase maturation nickel metallochaperone HypA [Candidatus Omnitrophica bacterium]|nr:hydrogenase maturation nickel metallochaperone HypA [Candidatus Omnitrophota bacterium]